MLNLLVQTVTSSSGTLRKRVEAVLDMALSTVSSLNEAFASAAPFIVEEGAAITDNPEKSAEPQNEVPGPVDASPNTETTSADDPVKQGKQGVEELQAQEPQPLEPGATAEASGEDIAEAEVVQPVGTNIDDRDGNGEDRSSADAHLEIHS